MRVKSLEECRMALYGQEHVDRYLATDGEEGHDWQGTQALILFTTGRKSGKQRTHPLIYGRHGDDYLVVASKGGAPENPEWYLNLESNPQVEVQVKDSRLRALARTATPEEKPELWAIMTKEWPAYDSYQEKTDREIPVVVLEPQ
jgi:deazaflavin-dependent oxidoreductase (nitroreductase family)